MSLSDLSDQVKGVPRGALAVIAVGLLACVAAALLTNENLVGAATLEWTASQKTPDSRAAKVPGSSATMRLTEGELRETEPNFAGYRLYRVSAVLEIAAGAPVGHARIECTTHVPKHVIVAKTTQRRAAFPVSTSDEAKLQKQEVKENLLLDFSAHGSELSLLEFSDAFDAYTSEPGVKVEWPPFHPEREEWRWFLPGGPPTETLKLGFASIWRTQRRPAARNVCTLTTGAGSATVSTAASLAE